eukprot:6206626-Pleurochrysis_carterae.AAC.6
MWRGATPARAARGRTALGCQRGVGSAAAERWPSARAHAARRRRRRHARPPRLSRSSAACAPAASPALAACVPSQHAAPPDRPFAAAAAAASPPHSPLLRRRRLAHAPPDSLAPAPPVAPVHASRVHSRRRHCGEQQQRARRRSWHARESTRHSARVTAALLRLLMATHLPTGCASCARWALSHPPRRLGPGAGWPERRAAAAASTAWRRRGGARVSCARARRSRLAALPSSVARRAGTYPVQSSSRDPACPWRQTRGAA